MRVDTKREASISTFSATALTRSLLLCQRLRLCFCWCYRNSSWRRNAKFASWEEVPRVIFPPDALFCIFLYLESKRVRVYTGKSVVFWLSLLCICLSALMMTCCHCFHFPYDLRRSRRVFTFPLVARLSFSHKHFFILEGTTVLYASGCASRCQCGKSCVVTARFGLPSWC